MSIRFTVTPNFEDYLASNRLIFRKTWLWRRAVGFALIIIMVLAYGMTSTDDANGLPLAIALAVSVIMGLAVSAAALFVAYKVQIRLSARRIFDQMGSIDLPTNFDLGDEKVVVSSDGGNTNLRWTQVLDFMQDQHILLLRRTAGLIFLIPKAQLPAGMLDEVAVLLSRVGVKET